jgi:ACR3 family arsenite efflux pump ArsB
MDDTLAGHMYEYILLVFAVFSIIHGLALLGVFRESFHDVIERKSFQYPFYIALGLWMMIFYIIVLYTNIPIEKDMKYERNYKIYCYLGGLSFLLVPFIWEIIEYFNPKLYTMPQDTQLMYMTLLMLVAIFIIFLVYIVTVRLKKLYDENRMSFTNIFTLNQTKQEKDKKEV